MTIALVRNHSSSDPLEIDPRKFACHSAVIAQSGSGKSFMLGRLIEELLLKTKARVVILDPNSDFVRLADVDSKVWASPPLRSWFFPGETETIFRTAWARVTLARPVSVDPMRSVDLQACAVGLNLALAFPCDSQICFEFGIDVG